MPSRYIITHILGINGIETDFVWLIWYISAIYFQIRSAYCVDKSWWNMPFIETRHGDGVADGAVAMLLRLWLQGAALWRQTFLKNTILTPSKQRVWVINDKTPFTALVISETELCWIGDKPLRNQWYYWFITIIVITGIIVFSTTSLLRLMHQPTTVYYVSYVTTQLCNVVTFIVPVCNSYWFYKQPSIPNLDTHIYCGLGCEWLPPQLINALVYIIKSSKMQILTCMVIASVHVYAHKWETQFTI